MLVRDLIQPFQLERSPVRGRLVRLGGALDSAFARHAYPEPVAALLAEATALAAVLASGLKYDGIFTLQAQGDGPVSLLLADLTSTGDLRAYARYDADALAAAAIDPAAPFRALMGRGHLAFTVDQGPDTDRYQGITELDGDTLADCAQAYFRQSEQMDTAIILIGHGGDGAGRGAHAAALTLQRLPGDTRQGAWDDEAQEDWRRAVVLMSTATPRELLDPAVGPADLLYRLFHEEGVRLFEERPLRHRCRCSRDRIRATLKSFDPAQVADMAEDGAITVTCEFCRADYAFDPENLDA
ncbi:MAG: Hsp33 family molecular chaperone HslO [Rhodobacterales bacterium]|nr:Hsp33 family molecular chaperone HslO [Rhodobacterales bacterium]